MVLYEIIPTAMRGSGTYFKGRAGEALGRGKVVYKGADGRWFLADADAVATMPTIGLTMEVVIENQILRIMKDGYLGRVDWTWTTGGKIYASTTAGELTQTPPAGIDDTIQQVGVASRTNMILFSPEGAGGGTGCAVLEGATAYVGSDECKEPFTNYFLVDGVGDGAILQAAIAHCFDNFGGGKVIIEGPVTIDDQDIVIPNLTSDLIIEGHGHRKGAGTIGQARESKSYLEFDGHHVTNALGAECNGRLIFRDLGIIFNGLTDTYGIDVEYIPFAFENVMFNEFNCTFVNYTDAFVSQTASPAPEAGMSWFRDCIFNLGSAANATGIYVHKEVLGVYNCHVSFGGTGQTFWMVTHPELPPGRGFNVLDHLECWFGSAAEACAVFRVFNAAKCVGIDSIVIASQAGAGDTTANIIFGLRAGQAWNTIVPAYVVTKGIDGTFLWGQAAATGLYLWEDGDAQERTSFVKGSQFGGVLILPETYYFILDSTAENVQNPGVSPGVAFAANLDQDVDLTQVTQARVLVRAQGNEAGNNKGVVIYNETDGAVLCDTGTWAGNAVEYAEGDWTNVTVNGIRNCNAYGYSDSGTEDIDCWVCKLELR